MFKIFTIIFIFIIFSSSFFEWYFRTISNFHKSTYVNIYSYIENELKKQLPRAKDNFIQLNYNSWTYEWLIIKTPFNLGSRIWPDLELFVPHLQMSSWETLSDLDTKFNNLDINYKKQFIQNWNDYIDLWYDYKNKTNKSIFLNNFYIYSYKPGEIPASLIDLWDAWYFWLLSWSGIISNENILVWWDVWSLFSVSSWVTVLEEDWVQSLNSWIVPYALDDLYIAMDYLKNLTWSTLTTTQLNALTNNGNSTATLTPWYYNINWNLNIWNNTTLELTWNSWSVYIIKINWNMRSQNVFDIKLIGWVRSEYVFFYINWNMDFRTQNSLKWVFIVEWNVVEYWWVAWTIPDNLTILAKWSINLQSRYEDLTISSVYKKTWWFWYRIR